MDNIKFIESLQRIMALATMAIRNTHELSEKIIQAMIDAVMGAAIRFFNLNQKAYV